MTRNLGYIWLTLLVCLSSLSCSQKNWKEMGGGSAGPGGHDVVVLGRPVMIRPIQPGMTVDAIEAPTSETDSPQAVVSFEIARVLKGRLPKVRAGGPSKWTQATNAMKAKDMLKLVTLDFTDPDDEVDKKWFRVAVIDPELSFGIRMGEEPEPHQYRIYLQQSAENPNSFIYVGSRFRRHV